MHGQRIIFVFVHLATFLWSSAGFADSEPLHFEMNARFLASPPGTVSLGDAHGDIAVSPIGEIYVSVQGGRHSGIQVYDSKGHYIRNVAGAPSDFHGFIIAATNGEIAKLYGARLIGQEILEMTLDGRILLAIPATRIPNQYKTNDKGTLSVHLTAVAVAPNEDIYVVDGYGRDFIHRFDKMGRYLETFGGHDSPWNFNQCHKIAIDTRFVPVRLLCTDRLHNRIVQMDLQGHVLGILADDLRWPSALAIYNKELAIAELGGRVSVLGLEGQRLASIGTNENPYEIKTNLVPPAKWNPQLFYAPHGITYDSHGNLFVTEWNLWGRVTMLRRK